MSNVNPYASTSVAYPIASTAGLKIAGQTQRFLTSILDNVVLLVLNWCMGLAVGMVLVMTSGEVTEQALATLQLFTTVLGLTIAVVYYTVMEGTTGRTFGKIIMGTQVLSKDGGKATMGQCLGRSACRFIPFEALSFLIGSNSRFPVGWHDRFAGTVVVSTR